VTGRDPASLAAHKSAANKPPHHPLQTSPERADAAKGFEPRILFVALVNNVGCERVIIEMSRHGALCALMSPNGYYCTKIQSLARHFSLPQGGIVWLTSLFVRRRLEFAVHDWRPSLVVPLDDIAAWLLRSLATDSSVTQPMRDLLVRSFGSPSGYRAAIDRNLLMDVASRVGVRKPQHKRIAYPRGEFSAPDDWAFPLFLKTEHSCGGDGVTAVKDRAQLLRELAAKNVRGPKRRLVSWVKNILRSIAGFEASSDDEIIVQSFAPGRPAFRSVAAWNGRVLSGVSFAAEQIHPEPTGASTVIRFIEHPEMNETAAAITAALGCSGFVSFDFMLDDERGHATLIEMNARCVGSCHLGGLFGHDICGALVAELAGSSASQPTEITNPKLVALFPKELERNPASPYLSSSEVLHDIPRNELALLEAYERHLVKLHPSQAGSIHSFIERAGSGSPAGVRSGENDLGRPEKIAQGHIF
jgi:hypothetical protein